MRAGVLFNPKAGRRKGTRLAARLNDLFAAQGIEAAFYFSDSAGLSRWKADRANFDLLVAAGGDGTISGVAQDCVDLGRPLGVLPLGTYNHFARDAGIPLKVEEAVQVVCGARIMRVDVGEVNGRVFINNSSLGAYPRAVEVREDLRKQWRLPKAMAMWLATLRTFATKPMLQTAITCDEERLIRATPFVFVGNNRYDVRLTSLQLRPRLDAGELCIYTARATGLGGFLKMAGLAAIGKLEQSRDFEMMLGQVVIVERNARSIRVSRDGEVERMQPPLRYRIRPKSLGVLVP